MWDFPSKTARFGPGEGGGGRRVSLQRDGIQEVVLGVVVFAKKFTISDLEGLLGWLSVPGTGLA
jgi:hypothetical protein